MNVAEEKDINERPKKPLEERFDALVELLKQHGIHFADDVTRPTVEPLSEHEPEQGK